MQTFDLVIIGSGPGGYRAAVLAALAGLQTAIVEKADWGGTCLNRGCVPKKAWYATARVLAARAGLAARGITGELAPDVPAAWRHQRHVVETVRASYVDYLKRLGVKRFAGAARFTGPRRVALGTETLEAAHVIVQSGLRLKGDLLLVANGLHEAAHGQGQDLLDLVRLGAIEATV